MLCIANVNLKYIFWVSLPLLRLRGHTTESVCESLLGFAVHFELVFVCLRVDLQLLSITLIQRRKWELTLIVLEQGAKLEVVLGVQVGLHGDIVLNELKEFLLKLVDFIGHEEGIDEREVTVREVSIVPDLLRY